MAPKTIVELCTNHLVSVGIFINKYDTHFGYVRLRPRGGGGGGSPHDGLLLVFT